MKITKKQLQRIIAEELGALAAVDAPDEEPAVCSACRGSGLRGGHGDTMSWRETPALCDVCRGTGKAPKLSAPERSFTAEASQMSMRKTRQVREAIGDPVKYYTEKAEYLQNAAEHLARALDWISEVQELDLQTPAGGDEDVNDLWDLIDEAESMASGLKDAVSAMVDMGMEG